MVHKPLTVMVVAAAHEHGEHERVLDEAFAAVAAAAHERGQQERVPDGGTLLLIMAPHEGSEQVFFLVFGGDCHDPPSVSPVGTKPVCLLPAGVVKRIWPTGNSCAKVQTCCTSQTR